MLKEACTAHYDTVIIARVTKQMFTNVKTKQNKTKKKKGLFYKSQVTNDYTMETLHVCQRVHAFLTSPWPMLLQISLRRILLARFAF